jgi:hypothetical protein
VCSEHSPGSLPGETLVFIIRKYRVADEQHQRETEMRKIIATAFVAAFAASMMPMTADAAAKPPAKTMMGCIKGKEKWSAVDGKCLATAKKPVAKAAAKKA